MDLVSAAVVATRRDSQGDALLEARVEPLRRETLRRVNSWSVPVVGPFDASRSRRVQNHGESECYGASEDADVISAVVFTPESWTSQDLARERETVVLSLVWLVSAVVSSVVRDVTLAVPAGLGLSEVADQSGCALVQAETEAERLAAAVVMAREPRLIVIKAGFQPEGGLVDELDIFMRREPEAATAVLLATPDTAIQRLFPKRSPIVGCLLPRSLALGADGFDRLARITRRRGTALQVRARAIR